MLKGGGTIYCKNRRKGVQLEVFVRFSWSTPQTIPLDRVTILRSAFFVIKSRTYNFLRKTVKKACFSYFSVSSKTNTKKYCCEKIDFLDKDISNLNNSFFKHYLRIKGYNFMQKFSRRACVIYFKNMFEFLNHSKFQKGVQLEVFVRFLWSTPQTIPLDEGNNSTIRFFCKSIKNLEIFPKNMLF